MKYFTLNELIASEVAFRDDIPNQPSQNVENNLRLLISELLDPLRELWGLPIRVNSGYRSPELNKVVGGVPTSQHLQGKAVDITAGSRAQNKTLFDLILSSGLEFDQIIEKQDYLFIHLSYNQHSCRRQILHY